MHGAQPSKSRASLLQEAVPAMKRCRAATPVGVPDEKVPCARQLPAPFALIGGERAPLAEYRGAQPKFGPSQEGANRLLQMTSPPAVGGETEPAAESKIHGSANGDSDDGLG